MQTTTGLHRCEDFYFSFGIYALRSGLPFDSNDILASRTPFGGGVYVHVHPWGGVSELFYSGNCVG